MTGWAANSILDGKLPTEEFLRAFPFYFVWDPAGAIIECGPSLRKICPAVERGRLIGDLFRLVRPRGEFSAASLRGFRDQLLVVEDRSNFRLLRGTCLCLEEADLGVMLATPWLTTPEQLTDYGLTLSDFATHDQTLDMLLLLQTKQTAANDLRSVNARLVEKRAELIEQEARARKLALVASSTDNIVILADAEMRFEWVNDAFTRMTGWDAEDVRRTCVWSFLGHTAANPLPLDEIVACLRSGQVFRTELPQTRRDGSRYWLSIEVQRLPDDAREVATAMVIGRDVTERKIAEEALKRSEAEARSQRDEARRQRDELEWIYSNAPIGICYFDPDLRFRRVNRWIAESFGMPVEDYVGKSVREVMPASASRLEQEALKVIRSGRPAHYEDIAAEAPTQPGVTRYFNESWYPALGESGEIVGLTLLVEEITDVRRVVAFKEADRRKNEFLATLAHELRNPLAPIKNALQLVQLSSEDTEESRRANSTVLRIAERQVDHLVRLVDDLLEVARITHGKVELRREETDLQSILPQAVDLVKPQLERKGHQLTFEPQTEPLPVYGDRVRLVQVFANLLDNAIKYTPSGGAISLIASMDGENVVVKVKDNGLGIPPERLSSIWDLFAQVEYGPRQARSGIGIGLALARNMIEMHGGRVGATSAGLGKGSEFVVAIPLSLRH